MNMQKRNDEMQQVSLIVVSFCIFAKKKSIFAYGSFFSAINAKRWQTIFSRFRSEKQRNGIQKYHSLYHQSIFEKLYPRAGLRKAQFQSDEWFVLTLYF